jgi:hypothetical protein
MHSSFLYQIKKIRSLSNFQGAGDVIDKTKTAFNQIDSMLEKKFYLVSSDVINHWMQVSSEMDLYKRRDYCAINWTS